MRSIQTPETHQKMSDQTTTNKLKRFRSTRSSSDAFSMDAFAPCGTVGTRHADRRHAKQHIHPTSHIIPG